MKIQWSSSALVLAASGLLLIPASGALAQRGGAPGGEMQNRPMQNGQMQNGQNQQMQEMQNQQRQAERMENSRNEDKKFIAKMYKGNNAEIQLGQLAMRKSQNQQVKQFAQRMIDDHSNLSQQMKPVAEQLKVQPTSAISKDAKKTEKKLDSLSGPQFDDAYMKAMVKDHKQDVRLVQENIGRTRDKAVKETAENALKVMQEHLKLAEQIDHSLSARASK